MTNYKIMLSSVAFIAILSGCGSATQESSSSNSKVEITEDSIQKNDAVYESEDSLVTTMSQRALEMDEGEFIEKSIDELVPELVNAYVPDSYVEEVLSIEALQSESLQANQTFIEELQEFYQATNEDASDNQRASNVSRLYDLTASLSEQIYDIIYNYLFGGGTTLGEAIDGIVGVLENDDENSTTTTDEASSETVSSEGSLNSSEAADESSSEVASSSSESIVDKIEDKVGDVVDDIKDVFTGDDESSSSAASEPAVSSASSSSETIVDKIEDKVGDVVDDIKDVFTGDDDESSSSAASEPAVSSASSSSETIVDKIEDKVGDVVDDIKDVFTGGDDESSSSVETASSSSITSSEASSSSASSEAQDESETEGTDGTALAPFTITQTVPDLDGSTYPKVYYSYTITSYDRIKEDISEGETVLVKILIPAGVKEVTMTAKGSNDLFDGSYYGVFDKDLGSFCGENKVCSEEQLSGLHNKNTFTSFEKFEETIYSGESLSVAEYRYLVIYNKNGGTDRFTEMKTQIKVGDKNIYNAWREDRPFEGGNGSIDGVAE